MKTFDVYALNDIEIVSGKGSYVTDAKGIRYLDMYGGHAVISIGHSHPHYVEMIAKQLSLIGFYSNSVRMPLQEALAYRLGVVSGKPDYQLFMCNSGAEANENALKLASFYNRRKTIVAFKNSFHGRTSLAVAATDNPSLSAPVNHTENVVFVPLNDENALTFIFKTHDVCAVIIEGIQGVGGIHCADDSFLRRIRSLCDETGAVFVADSVQCGYGRSGTFYAHDLSGVQADIYTMAKGMGNGFPVAGVSIHPKIHPFKGMLGTTFGGNYLACAAALAVIDVIEKERLTQNAEIMGNHLMEALKAIEGVSEVRGRGLMIGVQMDKDASGLKKILLGTHHIFTGSANDPALIRLLPPLNLSLRESDEFIGAFKEAVDRCAT